jgi:hypothetical protein
MFLIRKTMRGLFYLIIFLPLSLFGQVSLDWVQEDGGISIAVDASNNVYTINYVQGPGGDIILTKRDTDGIFQWDASYNNTDNTKFESATWLTVDSQNNILVSGDVNSGISSPVKANSIIMKFDPNGNLLWRHVYETTFDGSYTKRCLVDAEDNVYVLGLGTGPGGFVSKVKKFDPNGTSLWEYYDNAGIGAAQNFKLTPDGNIVISFRTTFGNLNGYSKIDTDGNLIWNIAGVPSLTVGDSDGDAFGNTYLVHAQTAGGGGSTVKKVSPEGAVLWENTYAISAFRIEVGSDNQPVICGFPNSGTPGSSFMKIDEDGNMIWQNLNADGVFNLLLHAHLIMDSFNNIYLAAGTLFEMAVCKVNADGSNGWLQTCSGGYANAIAIGNDNNVYVGGGNTAKFAQPSILGCLDSMACNFNPGATSDDGTCEYSSCICTGDLNGDNIISASDVLIFVPMFGCTSDCGAADLTGDGTVNTSDLLMFISLFGSSCL